MYRHTPLLGILLLAVPGSAWSYTQAEIDAAALVAEQIEIVADIADDVFQGRDNNTAESTAVQILLIDELKLISNGLNGAGVGDDAYKQAFSTSTTGTNLLGVIPGTDLADEYVIVGAHYDHLGAFGPDIFNGATDNAAGVAAVLAIGAAIQALPNPPRRSVILALWDAEEDGLVGSLAYTNSPLVPLLDTVAYVNFDILGANVLPSLRNTSFSIAAESGGSSLQGLVQSAVAQETLDTRPLTEPFGQSRSDYKNFLNVSIPTVFFSDATGGCYHTPGDDINVVDLGKLREQSRIAFRLVVDLAETSTPPTFVATAALPLYADAVVIADVTNASIVDIGVFTPADQTLLLGNQATLNQIVIDGPGNFDVADAVAVGVAALDILDALSLRTPCRAYFASDPSIPVMSPAGLLVFAAGLLGFIGYYRRRF